MNQIDIDRYNKGQDKYKCSLFTGILKNGTISMTLYNCGKREIWLGR